MDYIIYRFQKVFLPVFEKNLTLLLYGARSQGKSLHQAKLVIKIFNYLRRLYKYEPKLPQAIVLSNQLFSAEIEKQYLGTRLYYWESIHQLKVCPRQNCWVKDNNHPLHDAYIIFDDIATIIPADGWADLPKWFRKIFAQAGHNDVHCIANVQDPMSADINFRRYVDVAFKFKKLIGSRRPSVSKPAVTLVWGFYTTRKISAEELWRFGDRSEAEIEQMKKENPELHKANWNMSLHWIGRKATKIYNTLQNVPEFMPSKLEHIELLCNNKECGYVHVKHRPY